MISKVLHGQTLIDICLQELGDRERLFELMLMNNLSISDNLEAGTLINCPDYNYENREVVKIFSLDANKFASSEIVENAFIIEGLTISSTSILGVDSSGVKILHGQTLLDMCLQELGDRERLFELMLMNNLSISDDLEAGTLINCPDYDLSKKEVVKILSSSFNKPASSAEIRNDNGGLNIEGEGIGYWKIEDDFIIN